MKRIITLMSIAILAASCGVSKKAATLPVYDFPKLDQKGQIAIVAHRGFWKCEAAGMSENSIASLKAAQDNGFWGSECDIHITADGVVIVNHNNDIDGIKIHTNPWATLSTHLLPNGERRPTFDEYLDQAAKCRTTKLVVEFKKHETPELEDVLVDKALAAIKAHGLYSPDRVLFISFSKHICERIAALAPQFVNQYLNGEIDPDGLAQLGINGFDYHRKVVMGHPDWIVRAHALGMSVNVWTVNKEEEMKYMIDHEVDAITTNEPLTLRKLLDKAEFKLK